MAENIFYILSHPIDTLKAIALRTETSVLDDFASTNYSEISLTDAAKAVAKNRQSVDGGVQLTDWPKTAQTDMKAGQVIHPDGRTPKHNSV